MAEGAGTSTTTEKEKEKEGKRPPLYPVRFVWDHGGDDVSVVITAAPGGDVRTVKLRSFQEGHHEELIALNLGRYEYRFLVDSEMTFDMDLPALKNEQGSYCNMIKVKIPSFSAPQWNKAPREEANAKANAKAGRGLGRGLAKRQPLKSASSSKISTLRKTRADLAKSKSTPKVGAESERPKPEPEEVIQVPELRLVKCLSGGDVDTLILPAEGDNVLSQADTFLGDDLDDDEDLISDEDVPDLEEAFITAVSDPDAPVKAFLTEWNPLSSATATEDQDLFSLGTDPDDFDLAAEDILDDIMDEVYVGGHPVSMKEDNGSVIVPAHEEKDALDTNQSVGNTAVKGESDVLDDIPEKSQSVAEAPTSVETSTTPIPMIAVTDDDNGVDLVVDEVDEVDLALEELVMTMVNEVIAESVEKVSTESSTPPDEKGQSANLKSRADKGLEGRVIAKQEHSEQSDEMVASAGDVNYEDILSKQDEDEPTSKMALQDVEVEGASTMSGTHPDEKGQGTNLKSCSDEGSEAQDLTKQEQSEQPDEMVASTNDVNSEDIPNKQDKDEPTTKMALQDVEVEKASAMSCTLPDEKGQRANLESCSDEVLEAQDLAKKEQSEHSDQMAASTGDVHHEDIPGKKDKDEPMTKMALQDVEVIGQDTISKEVLYEVATLNVEEKEEKDQKNRRDSVTVVDKPITQVEAAQVAEVEECADLIAQAKEVNNVEGDEVVVDKEGKERKQSQVHSLCLPEESSIGAEESLVNVAHDVHERDEVTEQLPPTIKVEGATPPDSPTKLDWREAEESVHTTPADAEAFTVAEEAAAVQIDDTKSLPDDEVKQESQTADSEPRPLDKEGAILPDVQFQASMEDSSGVTVQGPDESVMSLIKEKDVVVAEETAKGTDAIAESESEPDAESGGVASEKIHASHETTCDVVQGSHEEEEVESTSPVSNPQPVSSDGTGQNCESELAPETVAETAIDERDGKAQQIPEEILVEIDVAPGEVGNTEEVEDKLPEEQEQSDSDIKTDKKQVGHEETAVEKSEDERREVELAENSPHENIPDSDIPNVTQDRLSRSSAETQMGNWPSGPPPRRGGGDIFGDVRQIQKDIQRSKSQSDFAISLKLQQSSKSKFLQGRFGSKSREPSVASGDRRVQSSASVSSVPQALAVAQERARKRDKSNPAKRKASKSRDTAKEQEKPTKKIQESNGPETAQIAKDDSLKEATKASEEGKDLEEAVVFQPSSKKPNNPFADAPKKLDEVFGDIRRSEPVPEVMPLDVDRNVAVYFETGDYSVSGLGENVKLKPKQLTARQIEQRARIQAEERKKKIKEPAFSVPGKPAKFPKLKKKSSEEENAPPKDEAAISDTVSKWVQDTVSADPPPPPQGIDEEKAEGPEKPHIPTRPISPPPPKPSSASPPPTRTHPEPPIDTLIQIEDHEQKKLEPPPEEGKVSVTENGFSEDRTSPSRSKVLPPKIGINGFEKIGRLVLRAALESGLDVKVVNDPFIPVKYMVYALKYDFAHTHVSFHKKPMEVRESPTGQIIVNGKIIEVFAEKESEKIPWQLCGVNYVVETSPQLGKTIEARKHLRKKSSKGADPDESSCHDVVVACPSADAPLFVAGVNSDPRFLTRSSVKAHASPVAAAVLPVLHTLHQHFGVAHCGYTLIRSIKGQNPGGAGGGSSSVKCPNTGPSKHSKAVKWDFDENLVPSEVPQLEEEVCRVMPNMVGKLSGVAVFVPTADVSMLDLTVRLKKEADNIYRDVCLKLKEASQTPEMSTVIRYVMKMSAQNSASTIYASDPHSCIVDAKNGRQLSKDTVKLLVWFDNDFGHANRIVDLIANTHLAHCDHLKREEAAIEEQK